MRSCGWGLRRDIGALSLPRVDPMRRRPCMNPMRRRPHEDPVRGRPRADQQENPHLPASPSGTSSLQIWATLHFCWLSPQAVALCHCHPKTLVQLPQWALLCSQPGDPSELLSHEKMLHVTGLSLLSLLCKGTCCEVNPQYS